MSLVLLLNKNNQGKAISVVLIRRRFVDFMGIKSTGTRPRNLGHCIQEKKVKVQKLSGLLNIADESGAIVIVVLRTLTKLNLRVPR